MFVLSMSLAGTLAIAEDGDDPGGILRSEINYRSVSHLKHSDDEGRLLAWEGTIEGDLNGEMKWWFVTPSPVSRSTYVGGRVIFYTARWEFRVGEELLLAGESAGKTVYGDGEDGMWDGHGVVTEANGEFKALKGRKIYETGPVILGVESPKSISGTGMFLIY